MEPKHAEERQSDQWKSVNAFPRVKTEFPLFTVLWGASVSHLSLQSFPLFYQVFVRLWSLFSHSPFPLLLLLVNEWLVLSAGSIVGLCEDHPLQGRSRLEYSENGSSTGRAKWRSVLLVLLLLLCVLCGSHHQFCLSFSLSLLPVSFLSVYSYGEPKRESLLSHTRSMVQEASERKRENDCNSMNIWLMTDRLTLTHSLTTLFPVRLFLVMLLLFRSTGTKGQLLVPSSSFPSSDLVSPPELLYSISLTVFSFTLSFLSLFRWS